MFLFLFTIPGWRVEHVDRERVQDGVRESETAAAADLPWTDRETAAGTEGAVPGIGRGESLGALLGFHVKSSVGPHMSVTCQVKRLVLVN